MFLVPDFDPDGCISDLRRYVRLCNYSFARHASHSWAAATLARWGTSDGEANDLHAGAAVYPQA